MIDRTNFLEPTPKYCEEFPDLSKDWFNADLIYFANANNDRESIDPELIKAYDKWKDFYGVQLTFDEVLEKFKDYPVDSFDDLTKELIYSILKN